MGIQLNNEGTGRRLLSGLFSILKWTVFLPVTLVYRTVQRFREERAVYRKLVEELKRLAEAEQLRRFEQANLLAELAVRQANDMMHLFREINELQEQKNAVLELLAEFGEDIEGCIYGPARRMLVEVSLYEECADEKTVQLICDKYNERLRQVLERHHGPITFDMVRMGTARNAAGHLTIVTANNIV